MASANRDASVTDHRRSGRKPAGPLAGWAWRDARHAVQFGKRQGAWAVELRPTCVRFLIDENTKSQAAGRRKQPRTGMGEATKVSELASWASATVGTSTTPRASVHDVHDGTPKKKKGKLASTRMSKRDERSHERLAKYQHKMRLRARWRRFLRSFLSRWRHERMWRVHNEWYAARSATAEPAVHAALEPERMLEDRGVKRAMEPADTGGNALTSISPPPSIPWESIFEQKEASSGLSPRTHGVVPPSGGGMNPAAPAFVPGQGMTGAIQPSNAAYEPGPHGGGKLSRQRRQRRMQHTDS